MVSDPGKALQVVPIEQPPAAMHANFAQIRGY